MFLDTPRFPVAVSYGARGGPSYKTMVSESHSGKENRNISWSLPRHEYDAAFSIRSHEDLEEVVSFFHVSHGRAYGFRYKDWLDYKSSGVNLPLADTDQLIGTGNGVISDFQILKIYSVGLVSKQRIITRPVSGSVVVAFDNVSQPSGWTVDVTTGVISFTVAPAIDVLITVGFEFDVPVRFDTDKISITIEDYNSLEARIPLIELKE